MRNFSVSSSLDSATTSVSASRSSWARPASSTGTSLSTTFWPSSV